MRAPCVLLATAFFLVTTLPWAARSDGDHWSVMWRGDSFAVEDAAPSSSSSGHVLVSPSGNFACGFREVATNTYTFAIWITAAADATVAWTANRDAPVNGRGSRFELRKDGSGLALEDFGGRVVWSTNTSATKADHAELLDNGNLVVSDASWRALWQSFDWPTDTLLPGQPITRYRRLVSASAKGLESSGFYNFYFDSNNILNLMYDGPEISSNYWPAAPSPGYGAPWWVNLRTAYNSSRYGSLDATGRFTASDNLQFNASDLGDPAVVMRRLTLDYDGNLRIYSLDASGAGTWQVTWVAMSRPCDIHGICGRYGLGGAPVYSCPEGFVVANASDWSKGCRREFDVRCGEDVDFAPMPVADFWGFDFNYTEWLTYDTCRQICLDDCNCEAFGYKKGVGQCYPKIALFSGRISDFRQVIYLKVPRRLERKFDPSVLRLGGHACTVREVRANTSASYLRRAIGGKINFVYFYSFLAGLFVMEVIFIAVGYLFVFRADPAARQIRDEGYSLVLSHFRRFTYDELSNATCQFSDEVARSASGAVYKGVLGDGRSVTVTRLEEVTQADEVFRSDLSIIGRINHMNLLREEARDLREAWLDEFVDARLRGDFSYLQAATMLEVAVSCVDDDPAKRPSMDAVVQKLLTSQDVVPPSMRHASSPVPEIRRQRHASFSVAEISHMV
ncbi:hypothetical protein ACQ4PT_060615 [Festuca glaucescens]